MNAGEGNIIAFNALNGVGIFGFAGDNTAWAILGNSIHDNGDLGIALQGCGANTPPSMITVTLMAVGMICKIIR